MPTQRNLTVVGLLAAGALIGWLATSGRPGSLRAQDRSHEKSPASGPQVLPVPDPPFRGVIGQTAKESRPDFPKQVTAPQGAPNVLLIMTDDTGFGAASTFGGPIPTPALDVSLRQACVNSSADSW
jgi:hypothetical protein